MKIETVLAYAQEALLAAMVALAVWPFGCIHPYFEMWISVAIFLSVVLWAARLAMSPELVGRLFASTLWPVLSLLAIVALVALPLYNTPLTHDEAKLTLISSLNTSPPETLVCAMDQAITPPAAWLATASSLNPDGSHRFLMHIALLAGLVAVASSFQDPRAVLYRLSVVAAITGAMLAVFAIGQGPAGAFKRMYWYFENASGYGPFINKNHYPFYANGLLGLTLGLFLERRERPYFSWARVQHDPVTLGILACLALQIAGVVISLSRGGVVSAALAILIVMLLRYQAGDSKRWASMLAYLGTSLLVLGLFYWVGFDVLESRLNTLSESDTYLRDGRWYLWQAAWDTWLRFPWWGSGGESFRYWETMFTDGGRTWNSIQAQASRADNEFLDVASEYGILVFVMLIIFIVTWLPAVLRSARRYPIVAGAAVGLLAVLLHSFGDFGLRIPANGALAAIVLGLALSAGAAESRSSIGWFRLTIGFALAAGFCVLCANAVKIASGKAQGDFFRAQARHAIAEDQFDLARPAIVNSVRFNSSSAELRLELARMSIAAARRTNVEADQQAWRCLALELAIGARQLCPLVYETPIWLYEYHELVTSGATRFEYLVRAHRLHPAQPQIAFALGEIHFEQGQTSEAYTIWRDSLAFSSDKLTDILKRALGDQAVADESKMREALEAILPNDPYVLWQASRSITNAVIKDEVLKRAAQGLPEWLPTLPSREIFQGHATAARIYTELGQLDASVKGFRTAMRFKPDDFQVRYEFARLLLGAERYSEARNEVRILNNLHGNRPPVTKLMQEIELAAGRR